MEANKPTVEGGKSIPVKKRVKVPKKEEDNQKEKKADTKEKEEKADIKEKKEEKEQESFAPGKRNQNIIVDGISIKEIKIEIDPKDAELSHFKKELELLIPKDITRHSIKFNLHNVNVSVANAIRRTIIAELPVKALVAKKVDTNDEFIIPGEILDRISLIPIDQTIPLEEEYSIDISNTTKNTLRVYSGNITGKTKGSYFTKYIHIAELQEGKYLHIPDITVEINYGYKHAKFMLTNDIAYCNLDIISVDVLNERANIVKRQVLLLDIQAAMKKAKYSAEEIDKVSYKSKILIIPDPINEKKLSTEERPKIAKKYPVLLREPIQYRSSLDTESRNFFLKVRTKGNVDPSWLMSMVCISLIERLNKVKKSVGTKMTNFKADSGLTVHSLMVEGETHTIGELLRRHIYELDPTITCLKKRMDHLRDRNVFIELVHSDPKGIIEKACDVCIGIFEKIQKSFKDR